MKRFGIVVFFLISLSFTTSAFAEVHTVIGQLQGPFMTPHFQITGTGFTVRSNVPHIWVDTEGDCYWHRRQRCRRVYTPDGRSYLECWYEPELSCQHERGFYPLPTSDVIYNGNNRIKFIRDNNYLTIAKKSRFPFSAFKKRKYVQIAVSQNFNQVTVSINTDK